MDQSILYCCPILTHADAGTWTYHLQKRNLPQKYIYTEKKPTCPHCRPWLGSHLIWHTSLTCARHGSSLRFYFIFLIFLNSIIEEVIWICASMLEIPKVSKVNYKNEKSWHKNTLLLTLKMFGKSFSKKKKKRKKKRCLVNKGAQQIIYIYIYIFMKFVLYYSQILSYYSNMVYI